jgi:hypothetical protein
MMRLRPATSDDDGFCFRLNEVSLREYIEPHHPGEPPEVV